ncbi:MAG: hypothetical protein HOY71_44165 [Nonomuraea sp.]|nr:hypothetical protein [Nonomuraea sp.]
MLRIGDVRMAFTDRRGDVSLPPSEVGRLGGAGAAETVARMNALVGPMIGQGCYEVRAGLAGLLRRAGIGDVRHDGRCTFEAPELYSYRGEGRDTARLSKEACL